MAMHVMGKPVKDQKIRSNTGMSQDPRTEERLMALEIKSSYAEDLLEQLNQLVYQQQQSIDALMAEVNQLRRQMPEGGPSAERTLRDELPVFIPHDSGSPEDHRPLGRINRLRRAVYPVLAAWRRQKAVAPPKETA